MSSHTAGPWRTKMNPRMSEGGLAIYSPSADYYIGEVWNASEEAAQNAANARLITSAPTMLVDLRAALAVCDRIVSQYGAVECGVDFSALQTRLRATIANAAGADA